MTKCGSHYGAAPPQNAKTERSGDSVKPHPFKPKPARRRRYTYNGEAVRPPRLVAPAWERDDKL